MVRHSCLRILVSELVALIILPRPSELPLDELLIKVTLDLLHSHRGGPALQMLPDPSPHVEMLPGGSRRLPSEKKTRLNSGPMRLQL